MTKYTETYNAGINFKKHLMLNLDTVAWWTVNRTKKFKRPFLFTFNKIRVSLLPMTRKYQLLLVQEPVIVIGYLLIQEPSGHTSNIMLEDEMPSHASFCQKTQR
jgi:hypothetical protein